MKILIYADDSPASKTAARLVKGLGFPSDTQIVLLGVKEKGIQMDALTSALSKIAAEQWEGYPHFQQLIRKGEVVDQILREANEGRYDLVAIGAESHHHIFPLHKIDSTISRLIQLLHTPLLVARKAPVQVKRILICTSAESYAASTIAQGSKLLAYSQAPISVLHVMSQISLSTHSTMNDLLDTAETAIQRQTREGTFLVQAMQDIRAAGVSAEIQPRLRHGLVLDEVMAEIKEYKVDILVIGSHHKSGQSWWMEHLLENVAKDLIQVAPCSVLVV